MEPIVYIDRISGKKETEKVYGEKAIKFLYSSGWGAPLVHASAKISFFSAAFGWVQKTSFSKKKIKPFIDQFEVDAAEFLDDVSAYQSFNDFFIRKLKKSCRPIANSDLVIPADARYWFYQDISKTPGFIVKNQKFDLGKLLEDDLLADRYAQGSMLIARLCPTDYHRFHFPCDCVPGPSKLINGYLYSVNPVAIRKNINIFTENKRSICQLETEKLGKVLYLEIGATSVGSICQTYKPGDFYAKGSEKGYFSFGGSSLIVIFEEGKIVFDQDLLEATKQGFEIRCLIGQSMANRRM